MNTSTGKTARRIVALFLVFAMMNLALSCNYFKVIKVEDVTAELGKDQIRHYQNLNKYFILHTPIRSYHMQVARLDADNNQMRVVLTDVEDRHMNYRPDARSNNRYKRGSAQEAMMNEVHLYSSVSASPAANGNAIIPLSTLTRMDIIEHDTGRTVSSHVFGTLGITAGVLGLITLIILLTKSSCPFVYVSNGSTYDFKGEIYGGAIFKPLERDDYMPLGQLTPSSDFKIRINNELKEIQYTNLAELIVAGHDPSVRSCIDSKGIVHTITNPLPPSQAVLNSTVSVLHELEKTDSSYCLFNDEHRESYRNDLQLTFSKPGNAAQAKLLLHAKNSWWLDYTFTKFTQLFGSYYNTFVEEKRSANKDSLLAWSSANSLPLAVYMKTGNGWKLIEELPTVGPMAARQFCIPVNLQGVEGEELEIKLSCGFLTWELDEAAVDYSSDGNIELTRILPTLATDEKGINVTKSLSATDGNYLLQPVPGNSCDILYQLPPLKKGMQYDCYLHARGYYEHVRNYTGIPDRDLLKSFRRTGAFSEFTYSLYKKLTVNSGLVASGQPHP